MADQTADRQDCMPLDQFIRVLTDSTPEEARKAAALVCRDEKALGALSAYCARYGLTVVAGAAGFVAGNVIAIESLAATPFTLGGSAVPAALAGTAAWKMGKMSTKAQRPARNFCSAVVEQAKAEFWSAMRVNPNTRTVFDLQTEVLPAPGE